MGWEVGGGREVPEGRDIMYQFSSVAQSCPTLCNPMNGSTPGLFVHHQLPEPGNMPGTGLNHTESIKDNIQMLTDLYQPM